MILDDLLDQASSADFVEQYYLKLPFSQPGGCRSLVDSGGWSLIEAVLDSPNVDALAIRGTEVWPDSLTCFKDARRLVAEGYTLRIRHAEKHDDRLDKLAGDFKVAFASPVDIHIYCTPANRPGLGWHYDAEDVFVLQTLGSKEWSLRKNTVNPWPLPETIPTNMRVERELMPIIRCNLSAGDWLYIPPGYWHSTRAGEESISLAVGILSTTAMDVFDFLRRELLPSMLWRQRLPTPGSASTLDDDELVRQYQGLFGDLARDLANTLTRDGLARDFLKARRSQ